MPVKMLGLQFTMNSTVCLLLLAVFLPAVLPQLSPKCTKETCPLPDCFCASRRGPLSLSIQETPKIVLFTFDDAVNEQNMKFYKRLFTKRRKNPNGCRIVATFFVSHDWTDYDMVKDLYLDGHEIGSHSITHRLPRTWWAKADYYDWQDEMAGQRDNIAEKAGVPYSMIKGVRVPFLEIGADKQFKLMRDEEFEYDASFLTGPYSSGDWRQPVWPYTLDFAPNLEFCDSKNCPTGNFSGIWEIPMNRWIGLDGRACPMVDACTTQTLNVKGDAYKYIKANFDRHFNGNRAPLGINMHATWFKKEHHFEAMDDFVEEMSARDDVWIVTMHQMVEWMRNPTPNDQLDSFEPWMTSCKKGRMLLGKKGRKQEKEKKKTKVKKMESEESEEEYYEDEYSEEKAKSKEVKKNRRGRRPRPTKSSEENVDVIRIKEEEVEEVEVEIIEPKRKAKEENTRPQHVHRPTEAPPRSGVTTNPNRINPNYNTYPGNNHHNPNFRYRPWSSAVSTSSSSSVMLFLTVSALALL